jgi:hypothetical protein
VETVQLSELLKTLSAYRLELQPQRYGNPDGAHPQLMNLRAAETGGAHGMKRLPALRGTLVRQQNCRPRDHCRADQPMAQAVGNVRRRVAAMPSPSSHRARVGTGILRRAESSITIELA